MRNKSFLRFLAMLCIMATVFSFGAPLALATGKEEAIALSETVAATVAASEDITDDTVVEDTAIGDDTTVEDPTTDDDAIVEKITNIVKG